MSKGPMREIRTIYDDSGNGGYVNRILIGTPTTGLVRMEWALARWGQLIPCNWSNVQMMQFMGSNYVTHQYLVADAQNMIVKAAIEGDFEWLFFVEHDNILPPDTFVKLNEYMIRGDTPVVSGLYFTRGYPSEPLVYRGRGTGYYGDWKLGDKVWCDGVPTGVLLVHMSIMRAMWAESEEYEVGGQRTRRVFDTPRKGWFNEQTGQFNATQGTSDLDWCTRIMAGDYLRKAGWTEFADEHPQYPFLVDTTIFSWHTNQDGTKFPLELSQWQR